MKRQSDEDGGDDDVELVDEELDLSDEPDEDDEPPSDDVEDEDESALAAFSRLRLRVP